ncbi:MAG: aquaporin [Gemmatimonadota bacterium]
MKPKALAAELLGTFMLALAVLISINNPDFPMGTPVIAGLTLGLLVYTIGPISGCHINPSVTLGLFSIGKIDAAGAGSYIVAQLIGGAAALGVGGLLFASPAEVTAANSLHVGLSEALGAAVLVFGVSSVVIGRVPEVMAGAVIGGSLSLGVSFAAHATNGVVNPAVALGIGSLSLAYVWGPLLGGVVGAMIASGLSDKAAEG